MSATLLPLGIITALAAAVGIYYPDSTFFCWLAALVCFLSALLFLFLIRKGQFAGQVLLYFSFGFAWCSFVSVHTTRPLQFSNSIPVYSECEVLDQPQPYALSCTFPARLLIQNTQYSVQAYSNHTIPFLIAGDKIRIVGELKPFTQLPTDRNSTLLLRSATSGTQATLTIKKIVSVERTSSSWKRLFIHYRESINQWIKDQIYSRMNGEGAVLCESLLLGNYQQLGMDTIADFRRTGLVHLLALSGLQMMMIWGFVEGFGSIIRLPYRPRLVFVLCGLLFYRLLLPTIASVDRALIMALWFVGARISGVKLSGWQAWGGALLTQSLLMPESVVTPGFQLSFSAVAGLLFVNPVQQRLFGRNSSVERPQIKTLQWLSFGLMTSLAAIVATTPFLIYHFGYISYTGLLWNIPAIPLSGLILLGTILLCCLAWTGSLAMWIAVGTERCGDVLLWLARFPGSTWGPGSTLFVWSLVFTIGFFWWVSTIAKRVKMERIFATTLIIASVIGYLVSSNQLTIEQNKLRSMVHRDSNQSVYVAPTSHDAGSFVRSWMREFGNRPLSVLVLRSESISNIPTNLNIVVKYAADFEPNTYTAISDRVVWQSVHVDEEEESRTGWGVLTDSTDNHYAYLEHLPSKELEQLGWNWQLPIGKRIPLAENTLPGSAKWLVQRWNNPD